MDLETRKMEQEHEQRLAELERQNVPNHGVSNFKPKLPPFNEQHNIDICLFRFEKYAESVGWGDD